MVPGGLHEGTGGVPVEFQRRDTLVLPLATGKSGVGRVVLFLVIVKVLWVGRAFWKGWNRNSSCFNSVGTGPDYS